MQQLAFERPQLATPPQSKGPDCKARSPTAALNRFRLRHHRGIVQAARSVGREEQLEKERVHGEDLVWEVEENGKQTPSSLAGCALADSADRRGTTCAARSIGSEAIYV